MHHRLSDIFEMLVICFIMKALSGFLMTKKQMTLKVHNVWKLHRPRICRMVC